THFGAWLRWSAGPARTARGNGGSPFSPRVPPPLRSCLADAYAEDSGGSHPDVVRRYFCDPRLEPGIDDRRALGLGIQMMGRPPCQHDPPLACLRIDLVGLHGDLKIGVGNTGTQVLVEDGIPRARDNGPFIDLVHDRH